MKSIIIRPAAAAVLAAALLAAPPADGARFKVEAGSPLAHTLSKVHPVREFRGEKPWESPSALTQAKDNGENTMRKVAVDKPFASFEGLGNYDFLEGPGGSTWFYTTEYDLKTVEFFGGYVEYQIIGYTFNIYDAEFNLVGTVTDEVKFGENETRAVSVVLDPAVTTRFFNDDANPEVMVYMAMNTTNYVNHYYYKVYSIGGEKDGDNDVAIATMEGRCVDAVNAATVPGAEDFYLTFAQDIQPDPDADYDSFVDFVNAYQSRITTYSKAGDDGLPVLAFETEVPLVSIPGDTTDGIYFISKVAGDKLYIVMSQYEKPYFVDPTGMAQDESATPDNNLVIDVYEIGSAKPTLISTTKIPVEIEDVAGQVNYTFLSIGSLAWRNDIDMSVNGTPAAPSYIVAVDRTTAANLETVSTDFMLYDNKGAVVKTLAKDIDGLIMLANIEGCEPQAMFVNLVDEKYVFSFVDLYSGKTVLTRGTELGDEELSATVARVADGKGAYQYAFVLSRDTVDDEGNQYVGVAWLNTDGKADHIDRINVGPNVARAQVNLTTSVLNPHLYDNDDAMEYAVLVGRYSNDGLGEVRNEFVVVDDSGKHYATFSEDDNKGLPYIFTVLFDGDKNYLNMVYHIDFKEYNIDVYRLPFVNTSSIESAVLEGADGISFNGEEVAAAGSYIEIVTVAGTKVAGAADRVSVASLASGIYIATATAADGSTTARKIAVK